MILGVLGLSHLGLVSAIAFSKKKVKTIAIDKLQFVINGVELNEVEAILGDLPIKRSNFRKTIKNIIDFHFWTPCSKSEKLKFIVRLNVLNKSCRK